MTARSIHLVLLNTLLALGLIGATALIWQGVAALNPSGVPLTGATMPELQAGTQAASRRAAGVARGSWSASYEAVAAADPATPAGHFEMWEVTPGDGETRGFGTLFWTLDGKEIETLVRVGSNGWPRRSEKTYREGGRENRLTAEYREEEIQLSANLGGAAQREMHLPLKQPVYDNDQLLFLVEGWPLSESFRTELNVLHQNTGQILKGQFAVTERTEVEVPAGRFDTYHIDLRFGGAGVQRLWVEAEPPHRMVKYDNGLLVMSLVDRQVSDSGSTHR